MQALLALAGIVGPFAFSNGFWYAIYPAAPKSAILSCISASKSRLSGLMSLCEIGGVRAKSTTMPGTSTRSGASGVPPTLQLEPLGSIQSSLPSMRTKGQGGCFLLAGWADDD